jgi:ferredoxin-type protein NapH
MKWLILRRISQVMVLVLFLLGPLAGVWLISGSLSGSMILKVLPLTDPVVFLQTLFAGHQPAATALSGALIVISFYLLAGGRVFCSWVCPVNIIADCAAWLRGKLGIRGVLFFSDSSRYWLLAMVCVLAFAFQSAVWEMINPVTIFSRGIIFGLSGAIVVGFTLFFFDLLLGKRGWCQICPTGAFYSLLGYLSPLKVIASDRQHCDQCLACYKVCPEPQVLHGPLKVKGASAVIRSGQCTNCGRCIDVCPHSVFEFGNRFTK